MNSWQFGDVVRVDFPFVDSMGRKERPAVIVSSTDYHSLRPDVMVIALSSRLTPIEKLGEYIITDWKSAGLDKPSRLKAVVATVKSDRLLSKLGRLTPNDQKQVEEMLSRIVGHATT